MSNCDETPFCPSDFGGAVRLFPLPNLVLFPGVSQLLHLFEPRYRQMMDEALACDRLIAMAVLAPGWEGDYEGRPRLYPTACLGRVMTHRREADGRYYLLLKGEARVRIESELPPDKLFREARATLLDDIYPEASAAARPALQQRLLDALRRTLPEAPELREPLELLFRKPMTLGLLADVAAYALDLDIEQKVSLLEELDVDRRAAKLLECLGSACGARGFPPDFSQN